MRNLFVYGTLINDDIQLALTGKTFTKSLAELEGFIVSNLQDRHSPGLKQKQGFTATGCVLHDVDDVSFMTIKAWENGDYELIEVKPGNGQFGVCYTYLWKYNTQDTVWDNNQFRNYHMQWYLNVDIPNFLSTYTA